MHANEKRLRKLLTVASSIHLAHPVEGVCNQVWQPPVQVHGRQAALVAVSGRNQLGQTVIHRLPHTTYIQLS